MKQLVWCPYCQGKMMKAGTDNYYCGNCKAIIRIAVEVSKADSLLLEIKE